MTVRPLTDGDETLLERLVASYPFKPYRDYRVWSRARQAAMLGAEVDRSRHAANAIALVCGEGTRAIVGLARPLAWDSAFFDLPMGRIDLLLRGPSASRDDLGAAVREVLDRCRAQGLQHLTARVDVADMAGVAALEGAGFRLMDALVTYYTHPRREPPPEVREVGRIRPYQPADAGPILDITADAYRGFRGRFQLDPHLPADRADAFYLEWARQCCAGAMADRIVVSEDGQGRLIGWASTRRVEPASSAGGVALWAGSLGACRRDMPGAYAGLIRRLAVENHRAGGVTETQTQNHNIATVRVYTAVGAQYVRGDYTFHAWLD